ncbi:MAG: TerB family tellurite resistance protein [Bacteroidales bacterium]|nr:TerB family tellurite resistance protein [Bacteroidales bacterium]
MSNILKWLLAGLGWAAGGPIGGILGYYLGKALFGDMSKSLPGGDAPHRGPYRNMGTQADINAALMVLIAAVMKADGSVKRSELDYVKRFLLTNYGEQRAKELLKVLRDLVEKEIPVQDVCVQIKFNTDYNTRYHMVDFLFGLANADSEFTFQEINTLRTIAGGLGISTRDYSSIYERHVGGSYGSQGRSRESAGSSSTYRRDPYKVLGIERTATDDEVRKAYRRMAMKYHPDKVEGLGEEVRRNAEAQMREINAAYDEIKSQRNMK